MIVSCEECGKAYRVNADKINGERAGFRCKVCNHLIMVSKEKASVQEDPGATAPISTAEPNQSGERPRGEALPEEPEFKKTPLFKVKGIGLRGKLMAFLLAPLILALFIGGAFSLRQTTRLGELIAAESTEIIREMAVREIENNARGVAEQVRLYLLSHPELKRQDFDKDTVFKGIAVQKVGSTGYTALHSTPDEMGVWRNWSHVNPRIVGLDMSSLKNTMGKAFPEFWEIFSAGKNGQESKGYYSWQDGDGRFRDKFMVCAPVKDTPFYVAGTAYLDEFTRPVKIIEQSSEMVVRRARNINIGAMMGTIILIGIIVFFYGREVTGDIKRLTLVAERISVGEFDVEIEVKSRNEIGELAEAISRMQESLRLAIERLRRRK